MSQETHEIVFATYIIAAFFFIFLLFSFLIIYNYVKIKLGKEKEILKAVFDTSEEERNRIADDLHDSIGSNIAVLKMYNEALKRNSLPEQVSSTIKNNSQVIDKLIEEIHLMCRGQSGKFIIDNGFIHELEYLKKSVSGYIAVHINNKKYETNHFSSEFEINLFRIIQELLQNAIKHSKCKSVTVDLETKENKFLMTFKDDGIGILSNQSLDRSGMRNISGRLKIFGGHYLIDSMQDKGTQYSFSFPLSKIRS